MTIQASNFIVSLADYVRCVKNDTSNWDFSLNKDGCPWFRGQDRDKGPIPKLFRDPGFEEFQLTRMFRDRAGAFRKTLETNRLDKWLFLMQHYGTPTRLLDWTESPLIALYFALDSYLKMPSPMKYSNKPTVWVLNPLILNKISGISGFPNTWVRKVSDTKKQPGSAIMNQNPALERFRLAFHPVDEWQKVINLPIVNLPIAVHTIYLDLRMYSQRSCFTIHGTEEIDLESLALRYDMESDKFLIKYEMAPDRCSDMLEDLKAMGINKATLFPDMEGLSSELAERFRRKVGKAT